MGITKYLCAEAEKRAWQERAERAEARAAALEAALFAEIDSNRRREDDLQALLIKNLGLPTAPSRRTELAPVAMPSAAPADGSEALGLAVETDEELVEARAQELVAQAAVNGWEYGPDAVEVLKAKIRQDPDAFFI